AALRDLHLLHAAGVHRPVPHELLHLPAAAPPPHERHRRRARGRAPNPDRRGEGKPERPLDPALHGWRLPGDGALHGPGDAAVRGSCPLRLLAVAVLAQAVTSLYIALSRVERRVGQIAFWQGVLLLSIAGLSWWLMGRFGIDGVGLGYLASQVVVALCLLPSI